MKKQIFLILLLVNAYICAFSQVNDSTQMVDEMELFASDAMMDDLIDEEEGASNYVPGLLHSSRDVYTNNTGYNFSIAWFKPRGIDSKYQTICMNGLMMGNLVTGRAAWSQWGGLNHVIRYPETVLNNNPATFTFGGIAGSTNYTLRPSTFRQQVRATYSLSNKSYNNRVMVTGATGLMKNNWAFTASLSARFGNGISYVKGTHYNGISYFLSAEKKISQAHALALTIFGAYTDRATQGNATQEAYDLVGSHYYNPYWGLQNGEVRASRVKKAHEPVVLLSHFYTPVDKKYTITSTLGSTFGKSTSSVLDWYDVPDPRPDYYRNLPSYQETDDARNAVISQWQNDINVRQIDWDKMYAINQFNKELGKRAQYIQKNYVTDHVQVAGASNIVAQVNNHLKVSGGIDVRGYHQRNYQQIADMLGGLFWIDNNKYAEEEAPNDPDVLYNDLDNKDKQLKVGDKYGYDYALNVFKEKVWVMNKFTYNAVEFHVGANVGATHYWRTGYMRNGLFKDNSKGKSAVENFIDLGLKAGFTYKINGRNYLILNATAASEAPNVTNIFRAPRTNNDYATDDEKINNEKYVSADFSYVMNYPVVKLRLSGYYTKFWDLHKLTTFYHDDYGALVNYSMTGIDQTYMGLEAGIEVKLGDMFSLVAAGNLGEYLYASNPEVTIVADNGYDELGTGKSQQQTVYIKNFHVAGTPQIAGTIGIKFNYDYWWAGINANFFDGFYADINPERRTSAARGTLDANSELYHKIVDQTKMKGQFTLDASLSKSWRIKRYMIGFNVSVTNILNNKNLVTTAWEQYRFDYKGNNVDKFPIKKYYAFGTTFYAGINFTFN